MIATTARHQQIAMTLLSIVALALPLQAQQLHYGEHPDDPPAAAAALDPGARSPAARVTAGQYVSIQVNVDAAGMNILGDAANEPSLAVDPLNGNNLAIGWRQFDNVVSNFRQGGWGFSRDGGVSWTFPGVLEPGVFRSDPVLDADSAGNFYYNSLMEDFSMDVWKSLDGGAGWLAPIDAFGGDKNWMTVDRSGGLGDGHVYGTWRRSFGCCGLDTLTRSTDGGGSFESPVEVTNAPALGTMAVGPDGELYLGGIRSNGFSEERDVYVVSRSDNARDPMVNPTFAGVVVDIGGTLNLFQDPPNPGGLSGQAWVAVDRSSGPRRGHVYLLGSVNPPGSDPLDVRIARSTDGGRTWSPSGRVNDDPADNGAYQWFATLSVAPNRRLDVIWNDTRDSGLSNISQLYYSYSYDGGLTFSPNIAVSPAWDSFIGWPNQNKIGDYYDMASDDFGADLAWSATFNGEQDVYYLRLFPDCNGNGTSDVADARSGASDDLDANDVPDECQGLVLLPAVPGTAGELNTFTVRGAQPGSTVSMLAGLSVGAFSVPGCGGLAIDLEGAFFLGAAVADPAGTAALERIVPEGATGRNVLFQAVDRAACTKSDLSETEF